MSDFRRWVVDRDYISGADALDIRALSLGIAPLIAPQKLLWTPDLPDLWYIDLSTENFHNLQDVLQATELPVDLFHRIDERFQIPLATGRFTRRLLGYRTASPREFAREYFADWRMIFLAETQRGTNALTIEEDAALGRVIGRKDGVLIDLSIGRQVRIVRVGLELAKTDHELAAIASGHLQEVIVSISTDLEFDMLAHECSLSPLLLDACQDFVSINEANWNSELKERWHSMLDD